MQICRRGARFASGVILSSPVSLREVVCQALLTPSPREEPGLDRNVFAQSLQTANVMRRDGEGASERRKESN